MMPPQQIYKIPSSFSFQSYFLFFNSFILHFYTSHAVDTCSLIPRILFVFFWTVNQVGKLSSVSTLHANKDFI